MLHASQEVLACHLLFSNYPNRWYVLTIVDLFLHESQLTAAYGYILIYFFISWTKFYADVLILAGTLQVFSCLISQRLEKPLIWVRIGEFLVIILWITALYYLGSYFANEFLWLNIADPDIIDDISSRMNKFEEAFFIVQYLLTFFMLITISVVLHLGDDPSIDQAYVRPEKLSGHFTYSSDLGYFAIAAAAVLWIRSFSELIIVIHYYLHQNSSSGTDAARDFIYGLCTTGFLLLIGPVANDTSCQECRNPVQQLVEEDCRRHVISTVKEAVDGGDQPPVLADVLRGVRQSPAAALSSKTASRLDGNNPNTMVTRYVEKMVRRYGTLRPEDLSREY